MYAYQCHLSSATWRGQQSRVSSRAAVRQFLFFRSFYRHGFGCSWVPIASLVLTILLSCCPMRILYSCSSRPAQDLFASHVAGNIFFVLSPFRTLAHSSPSSTSPHLPNPTNRPTTTWCSSKKRGPTSTLKMSKRTRSTWKW
jgi:hypothetical protein